jgi:hypothetical protein
MGELVLDDVGRDGPPGVVEVLPAHSEYLFFAPGGDEEEL